MLLSHLQEARKLIAMLHHVMMKREEVIKLKQGQIAISETVILDNNKTQNSSKFDIFINEFDA